METKNATSDGEKGRANFEDYLTRKLKYKTILKSIPAFSELNDEEDIEDILRAMRKKEFVIGQTIFEQGDDGNEFYMIEEGEVVVTKKRDILDESEKAQELQRLGEFKFFGEMAIIQDEPRSATVMVTSKKCVCLALDRSTFESIKMDLSKFDARARERRIEAVSKIPIFKTFTLEAKENIADGMVFKEYGPGEYICEEGTPGNVFYIILRGVCKVTKKRGKDLKDEELTILKKNDHFGEVALLNRMANRPNKRTASVVAMTHCNCLAMTRSKFDTLFPTNFHTLLLNHSALKRVVSQEYGAEYAKKRVVGMVGHRNSIFDLHERKNPKTTFKSLALHIYSGLKQNTYTMLYDLFFSNPRLCQEAGLASIADKMVTFGTTRHHQRRDRAGCVKTIRQAVHDALDTWWKKRSEQQIKLLHTIVQKNMISERTFENWPSFQVADLCRHIQRREYEHLEHIYQAGENGDCAYIVLRGIVRGLMSVDDKCQKTRNHSVAFSPSARSGMNTSRMSTTRTVDFEEKEKKGRTDEAGQAAKKGEGTLASPSTNSKDSAAAVTSGPPAFVTLKQQREARMIIPKRTTFKKVVDLRAGECFGNRALDGNGVRTLTMIAVGPVELMMVPGETMRKIRFHEECTMSTDDKVAFLQTIQLFTRVDLFKLYRIALKMKVQEIAKDEKVFEQDTVFEGLAFIFSGSVDLVALPPRKKQQASSSSKGKGAIPAGSKNGEFLRLATLSKGRYFGEASLMNVRFPKTFPKEKELVTAIAGLNLTILVLPSSSFDLLDQYIVDTIVRGHEEHCLFLQDRQKQIKKALKNLNKTHKVKQKDRSAKHQFLKYFPPSHRSASEKFLLEHSAESLSSQPLLNIDVSKMGQAFSSDRSRYNSMDASSMDSSRRSSLSTLATGAHDSLLPSIISSDSTVTSFSKRSSLVSGRNSIVSRSMPRFPVQRAQSKVNIYSDAIPNISSGRKGSEEEQYFTINGKFLDETQVPSCKHSMSIDSPETQGKVFFPEQMQLPTAVPYAGRLRGLSTHSLVDVHSRSHRGSIATRFAKAKLAKMEEGNSEDVWKAGAWKRPSTSLEAPKLYIKRHSNCSSLTTDTESTKPNDNVKLKHAVCSATSFVDRPNHWSPHGHQNKTSSNHISNIRVSVYQPKDTKEISVNFIQRMLDDKRIEKDAGVVSSELNANKQNRNSQRTSLASIPSISSLQNFNAPRRRRSSTSDSFLLPLLGSSSNT